MRYEYMTRFYHAQEGCAHYWDDELPGRWKQAWADITATGAFVVYRREQQKNPNDRSIERAVSFVMGGYGGLDRIFSTAKGLFGLPAQSPGGGGGGTIFKGSDDYGASLVLDTPTGRKKLTVRITVEGEE